MTTKNIFVLIPAAGSGQRISVELPKQYFTLAGKTVLEHTLEKCLAIPHLAKIVIAVAADDHRFKALPLSRHPKILSVVGGKERADSVCAALLAIKDEAQADDWVLVHDAARPCVSLEEIDALLAAVANHEAGGILALPMTDTVKQSDAQQHIVTTLPREKLWRAQTPQCFRYDILERALDSVRQKNIAITDDAMAVELLGYQPLLVPGRSSNIKITYPDDLYLAEKFLECK